MNIAGTLKRGVLLPAVANVATLILATCVSSKSAAAIRSLVGGRLVAVNVGLTTIHRGLATEAHYA